MKRSFILILIVFSFLFSLGFTSKPTTEQKNDFIMLSLDFSSNGQIVQSVDFSVNSHWINQEAISIKETLDFRNNLKKQIETIRNEFLFSFALTYMSNPNEEYKINKGVLLTAVTYNEENDSVGFKIGFTSLGAWNYYHQTNENNVEDSEISEKNDKKGNIFIKKVESKGIFPFSSPIKINENDEITVGQRYKNMYISSAQNLSFYDKLKSTYSPTFVYNYSTFNQKLRSDATTTFVDNSNHLHHLWLIEEENLNIDNCILLYYYSINKGVWLLSTLGITLGGMIMSIFIIKAKNKKSKV